jgi:tetratricopeptide (TPR) repeat protein
VRWHRKAGEELGFRAEFETIHHWERVRELLKELPETPENLSLAGRARGQLLWMQLRQGLAPEAADTLFREARSFADRANDRAGLARALRSYATYRLYAGLPGGSALATEAVSEANASGEQGTRIAACWSAASACYFTEDLASALEYCNQGIELCGDDLDAAIELVGYSSWIFLRALRASTLAVLGRLPEALDDLDLALADYGEKQQITQVVAYGFGAYVHRATGDYRAALAHGQRATEGFERLTMTVAAEVYCYGAQGVAQVLNGDWDGAIVSLDRALRISRELGIFAHQQPEFLSWKARAGLRRGQPEQALVAVEEGMAIAERMELVRPLGTAHLTRAAVLRQLEPDAHDRIAAEIDAGAAIIARVGARGEIPEVHEERAALCELRGDRSGHRRELEEAVRLYREMGAGPNAERIARSLG